MSEARLIGEVIDSLGVESRLNEGDLVSGAVVLLKVIDADGGVVQRVAWSDGMSWIEWRGMIEVARDAERTDMLDEDP